MVTAFLIAAATATAPIPDMTGDWWSNHYDMPRRGIRPGEASVVEAEITVDPNGHWLACVGHPHVGNPQMGPYVCDRLKKRAHFLPARDAAGNKAAGKFREIVTLANVTTERFSLRWPDSIGLGVDAPTSGQFQIQFALSADGTVSQCSLIEEIGINLRKHRQVVDPQTVERACAALPGKARGLVALDKAGQPVASVQNMHVFAHGTDGSGIDLDDTSTSASRK